MNYFWSMMRVTSELLIGEGFYFCQQFISCECFSVMQSTFTGIIRPSMDNYNIDEPKVKECNRSQPRYIFQCN